VTTPTKLTKDVIFAPLLWTGTRYYVLLTSLGALVLWAAFAYYTQLSTGLGVTGMRNIVSWAFYIVNFVFMIGISHAGTLISAILRVANADWRKPITRMAEAITVMSILVAAGLPLIDLGRPDRIANVVIFGRLQSPLTWDFIAIGTYLTGSLLYLYLPLIPDVAACRDSLTGASGFKKWLYTKLSLGWSGTVAQEARLKKAIRVMAVIIIPVAVSVHSVVSWDFAMTLRVEWHSTIFAPYFVTGAIFSGIATIIIIMAIFRRAYHLEDYLKPKHFIYLAYMMLAVNIAMIYFTISEYLVAGYGATTQDVTYLGLIFSGQYAPLFWTMVFGGLILPAVLVALPMTRTIKWLVVASILVDVGMWIERFLLVVPAMSVPQLPYPVGTYTPSWVEISLVVGALATFGLFLAIFGKIFPVVSIWETTEDGGAPTTRLLPSGAAPNVAMAAGPQPATSRRAFLRTAALAAGGLSAGLAIPMLASGMAPAQNGSGATPTKTLPSTAAGEAVTLSEAKSAALFPLAAPSKVPEGSSLRAVRVAGGGQLVALFYDSPALTPLAIYGDATAIVVFQSEAAQMDAPPAYLGQGFYTVSSSGTKYLARDQDGAEPSRLQWWLGGVSYTIMANASVAQLLDMANSMEAS
jgi:Ni/Fe-hydrogenase subunit HybB-like protein